MAGNGPAPEDPNRTPSRHKEAVPKTVLRRGRTEAPELPAFRIKRDEQLVEFMWPEHTREWWQMRIDSPQAEHFGSSTRPAAEHGPVPVDSVTVLIGPRRGPQPWPDGYWTIRLSNPAAETRVTPTRMKFTARRSS